jgi:hypothetical protein
MRGDMPNMRPTETLSNSFATQKDIASMDETETGNVCAIA